MNKVSLLFHIFANRPFGGFVLQVALYRQSDAGTCVCGGIEPAVAPAG